MVPVITFKEFLKQPSLATKNMSPISIVSSNNNEPEAVFLRPEIFEKLSQTEIWKEICEQWWEAHDNETVQVVSKGKERIKNRDYQDLTEF